MNSHIEAFGLFKISCEITQKLGRPHRDAHASVYELEAGSPDSLWGEEEQLISCSDLLSEESSPTGMQWFESYADLATPFVLASSFLPEPPKKTPENDALVHELQSRVLKLEQQLEQLLAERGPTDDDNAPTDPHAHWISHNREKLLAYPSSFVALDAQKGIVIHSSDGEDFEAQLGKLSPEERDQLMLFHTSMYS